MSTADNLLQRLDRVRRTGAETWVACCPAHDDKRPSLSIRETADGRVLLHCWTGCSAGEIVAAVGLELSDLFPPRERAPHEHRFPGERRPFPAADALRGVAVEALLVAVAAAQLAKGDPLSDSDRARLSVAAARLNAAADAAGVSR